MSLSSQTQAHDPWYSLEKDDVLTGLLTTPDGLTYDEVERRRKKYGLNTIPEVRGRSAFVRLALQFHHLLIYVLLMASAITAALGHWIDSTVILAVVVVNACIGFIQEGKADRAIKEIRSMMALKATVTRNGKRESMNADQLVLGDIITLTAGDRVPADLRVLEAHRVFVDESMLTGESVPSEKLESVSPISTPLAGRHCVLHSGTLLTTGQALGVVIATGANTELGLINQLLRSVDVMTTPLVEQMNHFSRWLTIIILSAACLLIGYGLFSTRYEFSELFMAVVALSVAAIPEGLPAVLTIALAVGVRAMASRNVIVRHLPSIETLGSVSVICTDKTGTLTRNEMVVSTALVGDRSFSISGQGYAPVGDISEPKNPSVTQESIDLALNELAMAALLCNDASLENRQDSWLVHGDPMEAALLTFSLKAGLDLQSQRKAHPRILEIPFNSSSRFMATLHRTAADEEVLLVKGAPETILSMCTHELISSNQQCPIRRQFWRNEVERVARQGQRVLAFALKTFGKEPSPRLDAESAPSELTFIGMVGLIDPPRPEAVLSVARCQEAGIRVKMITGDHAQTASAIGKALGLQSSDQVLTGQELELMNDEVLSQEVLVCDIFARTSPSDKLRLVQALQSHGLTVAMTGDGVNDAPALKRANVGVAMGQKGSDAAKDAADIILVDDNFSSIVAAVSEGRTVYQNIKKVIYWTLPTNAGEALIIGVALLLGLALPLTPVQILWINLATTITLGVVLAFEPADPRAMSRPPRQVGASLFSGRLIWHTGFVSALFVFAGYSVYLYGNSQGYSIVLCQTLVVNTLVILEIAHLLFVRYGYGQDNDWTWPGHNPVIWPLVAVMVFLQLLVTYTPTAQALFSLEAVSLSDFLLILVVGFAFLVFLEVERRLRHRVFSILHA